MTKNSERAIDAKLTRRAFVGAAAATAAVGLAGCAPAATDEAPAKDEDLPVTGKDPYANAEIFYSTCPPECQHHNLKALVKDGKVIESMPMPIAGLMSDQSGEWVDQKLTAIHEAAYRELGVNADVEPVMTLCFMSLAVIPEVKLTDMGLFDVTQFRFIPLEADGAAQPA